MVRIPIADKHVRILTFSSLHCQQSTHRKRFETNGNSGSTAKSVGCSCTAELVSLLAAKTTVAPVEQQSNTRSKLNDAVLLAKLLLECRNALRCEEAEVVAWIDSMVVLAWLRRHADDDRPTYVVNRWLSSSHITWPQQPQVDVESLVEVKKVVRCQVIQVEPMFELAYAFSSWMQLVRVTAQASA